MRNKSLPQPFVASLIAGLLSCLLPSNQFAQVKKGGSTTTATSAATSFRGGATGCSGLALGNVLSIVSSGTLSVSGSAQVQVSGLVIEGQSIAVTGQANQTVVVNGNTVIINEQVVSQAATTADITVNALHIITNTGLNLTFGSSSAGITCGIPPPQPPQCSDFVTGGGWITGTPSGAKANFGVAGGFKNGAFWGHLNYIDHDNGMHVKQTAVTGYAFDPNDADCRIIDYNVTIDGQAGTARVRVCDKGEPGRNDIFEIQLSNGYFAGGDLGGSRPGGGNIQLHDCE